MLRLIHSKWRVLGAATLIAASAVAQEIDLRFASARVSGTNFVMELAGIDDLACVLEATDTFPASWSEVPLAEPLADGEIEVPADRPQRFFRIRCGDDHSVNGAGYVALEFTPGFQLIANPFDNGENTLAEVLGEAWPFGMAVYQFDAVRQAYTATQFGRSEWLSDGQQLLPGAGAFIQLLAPSALVFGGLFDDSQTVAELAGGWNLAGSIAGATSAIVPEDGDRMVILAGGVYLNYSFELGEWEPAVPSTRLGEGYWYYRNRPGAEPPAGGCVLFTNFGPSVGGLGAPQFDPLGCRMESTNWLARLYAGPDEVSIAPVGEPVPFLSGQEEGFFNTGSNAVRYIESVAPGDIAVVQARMWSPWSGATYYEAMANGGSFSTTASFSVLTGGAGDPPSLPAGLAGLTSSGGMGPLGRQSAAAGATSSAKARSSSRLMIT